MGDLAEGVHTGIGAACAVEFERSFDDYGERALNRILHGVAMCLRLPSMIRTAIIANAEFEAHDAKVYMKHFLARLPAATLE
jgi:hypothetical protein